MRALRSNLAAAAATALLLSGTGCGDTNVGRESDIAASTQALAAVPPGTRPNINSLSPSQRTTLANAILAFITPEILDEHSAGHDWHHPSNGELFFIRHHEFTNKLETYLMANGLSQFVPLPYWDPGTTIPSEFLVVDQLVTQWGLNPTPNMPLPPAYNNLCAFPTAESLADSLEMYHDGVHQAIGGAMRAPVTAPGAVIFWLWHGFIDDLYHAYEARCENRKDFNRDVHTDVLWHNVDTGELGVWFLDGTTVANPGSLSWQAAESSGWQAKGTGDFNGDGRTDVLWHNPGTGSVAVWLLNGTTVIDDAVMNWTVLGSTGWELKGTGDFNRDGKIDLVWHNPGTGLVNVWLLNGTTVVSDPMLNWTVLGSTGWELKGTGDFNRDGHVDLLWHNPGTGTVATWLMNGTTVNSGPSLSWTVLASSGWELKGTGDFNRDGHVDVLWHQASTSTASVWLMNGTTVNNAAPLSWTAGHPWKLVSR